MKNIFLPLLIFFTISSFSVAKENFESFDDVISALKNGSAAEMSAFFDKTLEIAMPDNHNTCDKKRAQEVIQGFFTSIQVKGFDVIHKSESPNSQYIIGNLKSAGGTYRTTLYLKLKGNKLLLQEIRFEK